MGLKIGEFIADQKPQEEGVWIDFDEEQGVAFKIAYIDNRKYTNAFASLSMKARRKNRGRELPPHIFTQVTNEAMVGTILLDWKGLKDEIDDPDKPGQKKEVEFPFNEKNALRLLKESKVFRDFIQEESMILDNFQQGDAAPEEASDKEELKSGAAVAADEG